MAHSPDRDPLAPGASLLGLPLVPETWRHLPPILLRLTAARMASDPNHRWAGGAGEGGYHAARDEADRLARALQPTEIRGLLDAPWYPEWEDLAAGVDAWVGWWLRGATPDAETAHRWLAGLRDRRSGISFAIHHLSTGLEVPAEAPAVRDLLVGLATAPAGRTKALEGIRDRVRRAVLERLARLAEHATSPDVGTLASDALAAIHGARTSAPDGPLDAAALIALEPGVASMSQEEVVAVAQRLPVPPFRPAMNREAERRVLQLVWNVKRGERHALAFVLALWAATPTPEARLTLLAHGLLDDGPWWHDPAFVAEACETLTMLPPDHEVANTYRQLLGTCFPIAAPGPWLAAVLHLVSWPDSLRRRLEAWVSAGRPAFPMASLAPLLEHPDADLRQWTILELVPRASAAVAEASVVAQRPPGTSHGSRRTGAP